MDNYYFKGKKVAAYYRLSKEDELKKDESNSIVNQRKVIMNYANQHEFIVEKEFIDDGYSGADVNRPQFLEMLNAMKEKSIDVLLIKDVSRVNRNGKMGYDLIDDIIPLSGVDVIEVTKDKKLVGDTEYLMNNFINDYYVRDGSKKVIEILNAKRRRGEFIGAFAPYGYKKDEINKNKLVVDEVAAEVVKEIFGSYLNGAGLQTIAKKLNDKDIPCPTKYKEMRNLNYHNGNKLRKTTHWTYSTVRRILTAGVYQGNLEQGKSKNISPITKKKKAVNKESWIVVENTHEPIIDKETFKRVEKLLNERKRPMKTGEISMFAGTIKCGDCGRAMSKNKSKELVQYICGTYKRHGSKYCTRHSIKEDVLESKLIKIINAHLKLVKINKMCMESMEEYSQKVMNDHKEQLNKLEKDYQKKQSNYEEWLSRTYQDYREGIITKDEFVLFKKQELESTEKIKKEIEILDNKIRSTAKVLTDNSFLNELTEIGEIKELDREVIHRLIAKVEVFENQEILVDFKFKNEFEEALKQSTHILLPEVSLSHIRLGE
jgi:hypothetical protein